MEGSHYCAAPGCNSNTYRDKGRSFFRFPKDKERCFQWIENSGRVDLHKCDLQRMYNSYKLCSLHFEEKAFAGLSKSRLKKFALPTIFNIPSENPNTVKNEGNLLNNIPTASNTSDSASATQNTSSKLSAVICKASSNQSATIQNNEASKQSAVMRKTSSNKSVTQNNASSKQSAMIHKASSNQSKQKNASSRKSTVIHEVASNQSSTTQDNISSKQSEMIRKASSNQSATTQNNASSEQSKTKRNNSERQTLEKSESRITSANFEESYVSWINTSQDDSQMSADEDDSSVTSDQGGSQVNSDQDDSQMSADEDDSSANSDQGGSQVNSDQDDSQMSADEDDSSVNFDPDDSQAVASLIKKEETEYTELNDADPLPPISSAVCRLCLESGKNLFPLFTEVSNEQDEYREAVLSSIPVKVEKDDGLPQCICESCYNSLVQWHDFREMCLSSNIILRQYIINMSFSGNSKDLKIKDNNPTISENQNMPLGSIGSSLVTSNNKKINICTKRKRKEPKCKKKMKTSSNPTEVDNSKTSKNIGTSEGFGLSDVSQSHENHTDPKNLQPDNMLIDSVESKQKVNEEPVDSLNITFNEKSLTVTSNNELLNMTSNDTPSSEVKSKGEQILNVTSKYKQIVASTDKQLTGDKQNEIFDNT